MPKVLSIRDSSEGVKLSLREFIYKAYFGRGSFRV
jgi:hypothetical protein